MLQIKIKKFIEDFSLNVSMNVDREFLAILGPSGCGKTMTLKCIAGLVRPDEGYIALDDQVLFDSTNHIDIPIQQRKVGIVFQNYALFPHMNVFHNIAFPIRYLDKPQIEEKVSNLLEQMRLESLRQRFPSQLSAGQQQRVALARALASGPDILLLDEPFSALDTVVKERLLEELQDLNQLYQGYTLFVTHNLAEAYRLSSKIAVYESGQVIQLDRKQQITDFPTSISVAELVGIHNFLKGTIDKFDNNQARILLSGLNKRIGIDSKALAGHNPNQSVTIGIRPEYVTIANEAGENTLEARVVKRLDEVSSYVYHFDVKGQLHLEARMPKAAAPDLSTDQTCLLHLPPDKLFLLK